MKAELHILQNFPPANLNRDDTGTPKECDFGGERRARISSQCIKRSIRMSSVFTDTLGSDIGIRTKRATEPVADRLQKEHGRDEAEAQLLADAAFDELISLSDGGLSLGEDGRTKVLYYAAPSELADLASKVNDATLNTDMSDATEAWHTVRALGEDATKSDKKAAKDARKPLKKALKDAVKAFIKENQNRARSVDIALFGRMLAEEPKLNLEAACQVAHAISTNRVSMEFDYYTAVDDLNPDEETGAGMIGTTGYNSSCFYRYMLVDVRKLAENLAEDGEDAEANHERAVRGVEAFVRAAIAAIPTGKQNSFAAQARPSLILAVVRPEGSMPMSLVNAFERPARPHNGTSLVEDSVHKLDRHWAEMNSIYGDESAQSFLVMVDSAGTVDALSGARVDSVQALVDGVTGALNENQSRQGVAA